MAKTNDPKNFPGLSRQNIHSVTFIYSFHSLSIFFQSVYFHAFDSVCILFSWDNTGMFYQWIYSYITLIQITLKNDLHTILRLFNLIKHLCIWLIPISLGKFFLEKFFSYRLINKTLGKILETTIFFCSVLYVYLSQFIIPDCFFFLQQASIVETGSAETQTSDEWLKMHSIAEMNLTLKDLVDKGKIGK